MFVFLVIVLLDVVNFSNPQITPAAENGCWPHNVVLFEIENTFDAEDKFLIQQQMRAVSDRTCLRYIFRRDDFPVKDFPKKYLKVRKYYNNVYSRTVTERTHRSIIVTIQVGRRGLNKRSLRHELMHALGFRHEHQRVDRNCYVKVNWIHGKTFTPVSSFDIDYFNQDNDWIQRFPYDKFSIMHFPRSNKIRVKDERWNEWEPLGNTNGEFTWADVWKINYKHCNAPHYCEQYADECKEMEANETRMNNCPPE